MSDKHWIARYNDSSFLAQFPLEGPESRYVDIDRENLVEFQLLDADDGHLVFALFLDADQRLIYRRRTFKSYKDGVVTDQVFWLVGWQMTVGERNIQSVAYITEENLILLAGQFREDHPLFYGVVRTSEERGVLVVTSKTED